MKKLLLAASIALSLLQPAQAYEMNTISDAIINGHEITLMASPCWDRYDVGVDKKLPKNKAIILAISNPDSGETHRRIGCATIDAARELVVIYWDDNPDVPEYFAESVFKESAWSKQLTNSIKRNKK